MPAKIIDGKSYAQNLRGEIETYVYDFKSKHSIQPTLAVLLVGNDPASKVYVRNNCLLYTSPSPRDA